MGLYLGELIIGRTFASEIWEGFFLGGGGGGGGLLSEFYGIYLLRQHAKRTRSNIHVIFTN